MGSCSSCVIYSPQDSVIDSSGGFPPTVQALKGEQVLLVVRKTPGRLVKRRYKLPGQRGLHATSCVSCEYIVVTNHRLLVLLKEHDLTHLVVRWDDSRIRGVGVDLPEPDLTVFRWDGAILDNPSIQGDFELRLRTPHASVIQTAVEQQMKAAASRDE